MRKNLIARTNARRIIFIFLIFSGILISVLYIPLYLTSSQEKVTAGKITFYDLNSDPLTGTIKISGMGIPEGQQENINSITWSQVPNAIISFDAFDKMGLSLNLRIYKDSPYSRVMIGDHGPDKPANISIPAPGQPIKYVEIEARNVNFANSNVTLRLTDDEIANINETGLTIYIFDTIAQDWKELTTWIDTQNNTISATVDVMSVFALGTHVPGIPVYILDTSGKNWTTFKEILSEKWTNETPGEVNNIGNSDITLEIQTYPGNFLSNFYLHDSKDKSIAGHIRTYDKNKNLKSEKQTGILSTTTESEEIEFDALESKNVSVRMKLKNAGNGKIILDNYGKSNPVEIAPPGNNIKFVDIGAQNISFEFAQVRIQYTDEELGGADENTLVIYHWNGEAWDALTTTVDAGNNMLTATTSSLSPFAVSGGDASGIGSKILVATNRFVILDDPKRTGARNVTGSGFTLPNVDHTTWNNWNQKTTFINATALYIDENGVPVNDSIIRFTLYDPNGTVNLTSDVNTNLLGLANVSFEMNGTNFYGQWNIRAENGSIGMNTSFIYNWWGCSYSTSPCNYNHPANSRNPTASGSATVNSPYATGRDTTVNSRDDHYGGTVNCTFCHQSYDGRTGGAWGNWYNNSNFSSDVHRNVSCNNASCHQNLNQHRTNARIASCYNTTGGCHISRTDLSNRSTLNSSTVATALSLYSINSTAFNATFHTPNSTIPCIICHGPMHNISKPNTTLKLIVNNYTESGHCRICHVSYLEHNSSNTTSGGVNCTLCHSDDVHAIQVLDKYGSYVTLNKSNPNPNRGDCTSCHQNATLFDALKSKTRAGPQIGRNATQIPNPLHHSDIVNNGSRYGSYWTGDSADSCKYCHGLTLHKSAALGRPSFFRGSNQVNSTISGSTRSWCLLCHYPYSANYSDMVATFEGDSLSVPPSIIQGSAYYVSGKNHSYSAYNDSLCYSCHNHTGNATGITQFMHETVVGGGGRDCLSCHDIGSAGSILHVNNTVMKISIHANLNNQTVNSSGVSADNKKCWGCHQSDGSEPVESTMGDKYSDPYTCDQCHLIGNAPYTNMTGASYVTNHIWLDSSITRIITSNATCSTCHNNSVNLNTANITDQRTVSAVESVSHYGSVTDLIDTIADIQPSQGCVYCHLNTTNGSIWGGATDPRLSLARPHTETTNAQCYTCHIETTYLPDTFHNSSMYYAGAGKILVATNRYVILDDPVVTGKVAQTTANFSVPPRTGWTSDSWNGARTQIIGNALLVDRYGRPISNTNVTFKITNWNGANSTTSPNITTDSNGLANYTFDLNARNYYGNWNITASAIGLTGSSKFIYNWFGCQAGGTSCTEQHGSKTPGTATPSKQNSPYTLGRESITGINEDQHNSVVQSDANCVGCHRSYSGLGGRNTFTGQATKTSDVHVTNTCATCHASVSVHNTDQPIKSCYDCHNRTDITNKTTKNGIVSNYSKSTSSTYDRYHTPNSSVPCIICHGPMHAITKPDTTIRFQKNNITEYTHCISCHQDYVRHNRTVSCPVCHSEDIHAIKVFAQNATYITLDHDNPNTYRGNCTSCHQNSTFFNVLLSQPKAGNFTGQPKQIPAPMEHSNDPAAGQKWNQTPGYWNNSNQVTWCNYCHTDEVHSTNIFGHVSIFKGNNTVNSTISNNSTWCSSCHWQGYINGSNSYSDMSGTFISLNHQVPPEISGNAAYGANTSIYEYTNHSLYPKNDSSCNSCHGYRSGFTTITQLVHNLSRVGGPNCVECHDTGGLALLAHVNVSATNDSNAIHKNLNSAASSSNSTAYYANNKRCWACHGNASEPTNGHPSNYKTPYRCENCHIKHIGAPIYFTCPICHGSNPILSVEQHYWNGTSIKTPAVTTCYLCHNKSEMLIPANDPDNGSGAVYGGENGGNSSSSHYGKKRTDIRIGASVNCSYCHQNTSTVFASAMANTGNSTILNHSMRYNSSNPTCTSSLCHNTGRLHNSTLTKPSIALPNSNYCLSCHGSNGSGGTNYSGAVTGMKAKHNNTINCTECHLNTSKDIHPVKYLQSNTSFGSTNSTGVNCISCHQDSTVYSSLSRTPPKIPNPMHHSDNISNGTIWNSTGYWTSNSTITSCIYCHNDTKHNSSALGRPALWKGNNVVNGSINTSNWCSSCHYRGYSSGGNNYNNMTAAFISSNLSVPPEITNGTYAPFNLSRYYNHSLTNYSDATCLLCHGTNISSNSGISAFLHNLSRGSCTSCHYSFEAMNRTLRPDRFVDSDMYNTSLHRSLACQTCHTQGHKNIGARKACEDCHVVQTTPITDKDRHNITETPSTNMYGGTSVVNITDCAICHNSALLNNSRNTYGYGKSKDCDYCHTNPDKYYN